MNPEVQQLSNQLFEQASGNPLGPAIFLALIYGGSGLRYIFHAICDNLIARLWTWITLKILSFMFDSPSLRVYMFLHLYILFRRRCIQDFFQSALRAVSRDGADEDHYHDLLKTGFRFLVYGSGLFVLANLRAFYSLAMAWSPLISTVVGTVLAIWTIGVYHFDMPLLAPLNKLFQLLFAFMQVGIWIAPFVGKLVIATYAYAGRAFRKLYVCKVRLLGDNKPAHWGQAYVYAPLADTRSIRLLQISRKGPFGEYSCKIVHTTLDETPAFEAISYHWGDPSLKSNLMIDGRSLRVTPRVIEIVQSRASFVGQKLLWIDSVCINQCDLVEKGLQIRLMMDIYRTADRVLVWLGTAPDAFHAHSYIAHVSRKLLWSSDTKMRENLLQTMSTDVRGVAVARFLNHPWWTRAWIIQEVAVAKNVIISYGNEYVSWAYLETFFHLVKTLTPGSLVSVFGLDDKLKVTMPAAVGQLPILTEIRNRFHTTGPTLTIIELLSVTLSCQASNPRDKIYAFLGLSTGKDEPLLIPDYTIPAESVFVKTARYLHCQDSLKTLAFAGVGHIREIQTLPSWVPDFSCIKHSVMLQISSNAPNVAAAYHAAGDSHPSYEVHQSFPVLRSRSILFDSIARLGPKCNVLSEGVNELKEMSKSSSMGFVEIANFIRDSITSETYSFTGQARDEVIWRVKLGDRILAGETSQRPAPDVYRQYFHTILKHSINMADQFTKLDEEDWLDKILESRPQPELHWEATTKFAIATGMAGTGKRMAVTRKGAICQVPVMSQVGDIVGVMSGAQACMVLRREAMPGITKRRAASINGSNTMGTLAYRWENPQWRFVGNCYVHGFMDGEALSTGRRWEDVYIW